MLTINDSLYSQTKKIGVAQAVASDEDASNQNNKPSTPPSHTPSIFTHYFHIITRTCMPLETATIFIPSLAFSYNIHTPSYPMFRNTPSCYNPMKLGRKTLSSCLELSHIKRSRTAHTKKTKIY